MTFDDDANERMIREQLVARGIRDERVLAAFRAVPRELFVPSPHHASAYDDTPLPLERGQTISQPFIVGLMTQLLQLRADERVLEIGTGSGYQTAILAKLAREVFSAEVDEGLARRAAAHLRTLQITNTHLGIGNGVTLFRDAAPFDAILAAAAPTEIPDALLEQLADGGRCIMPAGAEEKQFLWRIERRGGRLVRERLEEVRFVPMV